jgi:hypothetical protein
VTAGRAIMAAMSDPAADTEAGGAPQRGPRGRADRITWHGPATVEWGDDRPARWFDRFIGYPQGGARRRLSAPAIGSAVVATLLMLAAELLPWGTVSTDATSQGQLNGSSVDNLYLGDAAGFLLAGYYPGWLALLGLIGTALVARPAGRRRLIGGGLGVAAGLLVLTAGAARAILAGNAFRSVVAVDIGSGPGMFFGFAAVLAAAAALVLTGWRPGRRRLRAPDEEPDVEPGPPDLTVSPVR